MSIRNSWSCHWKRNKEPNIYIYMATGYSYTLAPACRNHHHNINQNNNKNEVLLYISFTSKLQQARLLLTSPQVARCQNPFIAHRGLPSKQEAKQKFMSVTITK
jgi:hypothetical protein